MSWLFKSLQASDDNVSAESQFNSSSLSLDCAHFTTAVPSVEDDYSALGETLSRQLRGFTNFLAPQPSSAVVSPADSSDSCSNSSSPSQTLQGIRNDLAEIGGGLRNGFSMLSVKSNKAVGEISRLASNLLPFLSRSTDDAIDEEFNDEIIDDTPGITNEVLSFVNDISSRPEYWTDFPLALDETDFKMSEVQRMHISTVEQLVPSISSLKIKLQSFMSNELFWMIYYILLLPRFDQPDFELLATSEIVEARNTLLDKLQTQNTSRVNSEDTCDQQKGNMASEEKANSSQIIEGGEGLEIGEKTNQGLEKADSKTSTDAKKGVRLEGISFSDSDIEEEDGTDLAGRTKPPRTSSSAESNDWVQLHENPVPKLGQQKAWKQDRDSEGGDSSDWFNVDEFD